MERDVEKEHEKGQSQYGRRISDPKEIQERCAHVYVEGRKKKHSLCKLELDKDFSVLLRTKADFSL